ncbi:hypothetical protein FIV42_08485 [Persicimonas caeni]|uniref:Type 4 fimbrial biogenesis protein PilX N-terminal domain-containing protein n=1 Tax=Persicimonas caeni TaxID=2292766 RepID=A0A4Y6PR29_PERCE|nr:hypothetical protein [Persicimonas caeni]QDG50766.1 hypothetical protein FIV42_08485 [Persicimonas caeni]QED31987.1 hypothetical protein FRD00_08480 [Persicimonas caeni]
MNTNRTTTRKWLAQQQGSALILTMLVLLVLTGLGMLAMRDTRASLQQSGAYRVRAQATGLAEAASGYTAYMAGKDASGFWAMMQSPQVTNLSQLSSANARQAEARRGAYLHLKQKAGSGDKVFPNVTAITGETGLLTNGSKKSFEARESSSQFEVVLRDPMDGPPAAGYGENYCFKKITVVSRGLVGEPSHDWSGSGMVADKRTAIETYIGPIECGAQ